MEPKGPNRIHKRPPPVVIISQLDPVHTPTSILILSFYLCLGLPSGPFPSGFPTKTLHAPLPSDTRATRPTHLILLDFITRHNIEWAVQIIKLLIITHF